MDKPDIEQAVAGDFSLSASGDYAHYDEGTPVKVHVEYVKKIVTENFEKTGMVTKAVVGFKTDEPNEDGEGEGQIYTKWFTPSLNPKSGLSKLLVALFGEIPKSIDLVQDLVGMPAKVLMVTKETDNGPKQQIGTFVKPGKDQKRVEVATPDVVPTDLSDEINLDDLPF